MKSTTLLSGLTLFLGATAAPLSSLRARNSGSYTPYVTIHQSCNATQTRMLHKALEDTWEVITYAQNYTAWHGPNDTIFQQYFGTNSHNFAAVLGVWEAMLVSDKQGVLFRCDNIDGNCNQVGWRGHWRGNNGSSETVICDASYTDRKYNSDFCMYGYQLAAKAPSYYWSIDLIHRLLHVPQITNAAVQHYAEDLDEVFELAAHNATYSPFDSDALQYYAAHVYALKVGGGDACLGDLNSVGHDHSHAAPSSTAASSAASTTRTSAASATSATRASAAPAASTTQDCHTHADGTVHCV